MTQQETGVGRAVARLRDAWQRRPRRGLAAAALWLLLALPILWPAHLLGGSIGTSCTVLSLVDAIALAVVGIPLLLRLIRSRMLWSLRNKLVLTYLLIGLAPVVLFVTLVLISAYVAAGQFAIHLADTRVQVQLDQLGTENAGRIARVARLLNDHASESTAAELARRSQDISDTERVTAMATEQPRLRHYLEVFMNGAPVPLSADVPAPPSPLGIPPWAGELKAGFRSLVLDGDNLCLVAIDRQRIADGRVLTLVSSLPVDNAFMDVIADGLGRAHIFTQPAQGERQIQKDLHTIRRRRQNQLASLVGGAEPPKLNFADIRVRFLSTTTVTDWDTGGPDSIPIEVDSRPSLLYLQLFGASLSGVVTSAIRIGLISLCVLFALIETLALVMALRLSRTMTTSVADLYEATLRIDRGDLEHKIAVYRNDQLAELSRSFNRMTVSLQRLLIERQEKERMQNELSIAQEVQANLFPTSVQSLPTLELHGVCRPARSVSGDYYDFLVFHRNGVDGTKPVESGVGIALGDISGKGISAALLMATLHSAVRAYRFASEAVVQSGSSFAALASTQNGHEDDCGELFESPGRIMELLNRHLYRSTQPEKYATLFLAHYDAATSWLTYSNAGQLPPLLLSRDGHIHRCDRGGTVVGLMDDMRYEEGRYQLRSGDILVAYSDGVTEPENEFGDFGEERLIEVIRRYRDQPLHIISSQVMQALDAWIGAEEQPDDITLVLARQA